jgi:long-chain fatty acid transport protein
MFSCSSARAARFAAVTLSLALVPATSSASGFSIYEQGGRAMGFAGAYTAVTDDPSAIFHNAGGIAFLDGTRVYFGGTLVAPKSSFLGADPLPGAGILEKQDVGVIPVPTFYFTQGLGKSVVWGVGVYTPYGLRTEWANPDTFTGRHISLEADLKGVAINPTVALKLTSQLSVGVGLDVRLAKVQLRRRVPSINPFTQQVVDIAEAKLESGYDSGIGFNVGVVAKPTEELSLGVSYRHRVKVDFEGEATFTLVSTGDSRLDPLVAANPLLKGRPPLTTSITFPGILSGGMAYDWKRWTVTADAVWFNWSTFDQLALTFPDRPQLDQTVIEDYRNNWQFRAGVERRLGEHWAVRGGYHYDQTPVPVESVSPLLPDQDRHGLALGGSWVRERWRVDAGLWYLFLSPRSTEGRNRDDYNGSYDNSALTLGISLGHRF